eukprot:10666563-Karenia_brevis.AAC.1
MEPWKNQWKAAEINGSRCLSQWVSCESLRTLAMLIDFYSPLMPERSKRSPRDRRTEKSTDFHRFPPISIDFFTAHGTSSLRVPRS